MMSANVLSPLEGEMAAKRPEGGGAEGRQPSQLPVKKGASSPAEVTPPPAYGRTLPSRGTLARLEVF